MAGQAVAAREKLIFAVCSTAFSPSGFCVGQQQVREGIGMAMKKRAAGRLGEGRRKACVPMLPPGTRLVFIVFPGDGVAYCEEVMILAERARASLSLLSENLPCGRRSRIA
ncbi:MAG TPA: hypothetical protein VL485_02990 [Ktedonobacteraceae bacterium]|jgi:hypothetical protein|nr:hypothetical protein [Ktedonobacteraceae bacterium]